MLSKPESYRAPRKRFSIEEDKVLSNLVKRFGTNDWSKIAAYMEDRDARQCRHRFKNYLMETHKSLPWTIEEDNFIIQQFQIIGARWVFISKSLAGRTGNDVKNRWHKHLCKRVEFLPALKKNAAIKQYDSQQPQSDFPQTQINIMKINIPEAPLDSTFNQCLKKNPSIFLQVVLN